jgi:hypothetical protein
MSAKKLIKYQNSVAKQNFCNLSPRLLKRCVHAKHGVLLSLKPAPFSLLKAIAGKLYVCERLPLPPPSCAQPLVLGRPLFSAESHL